MEKQTHTLTFLLLRRELCLGELDVEGDVERAEEVVVFIVWHPLALLADAGAWPCGLLPHHVYLRERGG